jgi:hypothetical protein
MQISRDILDRMRRPAPKKFSRQAKIPRVPISQRYFVDKVWDDFSENAESMGFSIHFNKGRALDAFHLWNDDMDRLEKHEPDIELASHLKCAAYLTFWLRRSSPVDLLVAVDPPPYVMTPDTTEFMLKYGREYLAFDFGYRIAHAYETYINGRNLPEGSFPLYSFDEAIEPNNFVNTACHVMKTKEISPFSIYLIFKAIFLRPRDGIIQPS